MKSQRQLRNQLGELIARGCILPEVAERIRRKQRRVERLQKERRESKWR